MFVRDISIDDVMRLVDSELADIGVLRDIVANREEENSQLYNELYETSLDSEQTSSNIKYQTEVDVEYDGLSTTDISNLTLPNEYN